MKKILLAVVAFIGLSTIALANDSVNHEVVEAFKEDYANAKGVKWSVSEDIVQVKFSLDGKLRFVYYDNEGNRVAEGKYLCSSDLPPGLMEDIRKKYPDHFASQLFELTQNGVRAYYVFINNHSSSITIKATSTDKWKVYKREKL